MQKRPFGQSNPQSPPNEIMGSLSRAIALHQAGNLAEAERLYRLVLAADQDQFDALHYLGMLEAQRGRNEEACRLIGRALQTDKTRPDAFSNHARVLNALGRHQEALESCNQALAISPHRFDVLTHRGNALRILKRLEEALASYDEALRFKPDYAVALINRGNVLYDLARYDRAAASYGKAIALNPRHAEAHMHLGTALRALGRPDEAVGKYRDAIALKPDSAEAHMNLGNLLHETNRPAEAVRCHERALELQPAYAAAHHNLGNALQALNRYSDAIRHYQEALALNPNLPEAHEVHLGIGNALQALDRDDEADRQFDRALALEPDFAAAGYNKCVLHLTLGRLAEGWERYELRWVAGGKGMIRRAYPQPSWTGDRVRGQLLAWGEQGLGDQILHASMIPDLIARSDSVVLEVEPRLVRLFARSFPDVHVVPIATELYGGRVDAQVAMGSLGRHLRPSFEALQPPPKGYLAVDDMRATRLRDRLTQDKRLVIGLSWRSHNPVWGKSKSAQLRDLESLLRLPGCRFIDLQYGDTLEERTGVERETGVTVERLDDIDNTNDIDGLAALIKACDVVVTVSNTTAHLAGAVGVPTWVFVPFGYARLWYWFKYREQSPWYPRVRVKRQADGQSWADLISSTAQEISTFRASVK